MGQFIPVDGNFSQLSAASATVVWGVNTKNDIYNYQNGSGCAQDPWARVDGALQQICAGSADAIWGVDSACNVYQRTTKGWTLELDGHSPPLPKDIVGAAWGVDGLAAVATDGTVCVLIDIENVSDPAAPPAFFTLAYRWSGSAFQLISDIGTVAQIAVGDANHIWALAPPSAQGSSLMKFTGALDNPWSFVSGAPPLASISAGTQGALWGIDLSGNIYRYPGDTNEGWTKLPGNLTTIQVGSPGNVWGINSAGAIYRYTGNDSDPWELNTGTFEQVSVAADGTTWALSAAGDPYLYVAQYPNGPNGKPGSYANYILCAAAANPTSTSCKSLHGVQVSIRITEPLSGAGGFSFQLNANSQGAVKPAVVWQQYAILVGTEISFAINNWTTSELKPGGSPIVNLPASKTVSLPPQSVPTLAVGYVLTIALGFDGQDNVNAVTFTVVDSGGTVHHIPPINLVPPTVATANVAPIVAFELDIVGADCGHHTQFSSGGGVITYTASTALVALDQIPPCAALGETTGETSNTVYGSLPVSQSSTFTQCFSVDTTAAPRVHDHSTPHRGFVRPTTSDS